VYNTILKSKEWLNVTYAINIGARFLPQFYILWGEKIKDDYVKNYKPKTCMDI
jgi:hypothetical protein